MPSLVQDYLQPWTHVFKKVPPSSHFNVVVELVIPWIELTNPTLNGGAGNFPRQYIHRLTLDSCIEKNYPFLRFNVFVESVVPLIEFNIERRRGEFSNNNNKITQYYLFHLVLQKSIAPHEIGTL